MSTTQSETGGVEQNGERMPVEPSNEGLEKQYRYDRDQMIRISKCDLSLRRPSYLSTDFDKCAFFFLCIIDFQFLFSTSALNEWIL